MKYSMYVKAWAITTPSIENHLIKNILLKYKTRSEKISDIIYSLVSFFAKNWYPKIIDNALKKSPINCQKNNLEIGRNSLVKSSWMIYSFRRNTIINLKIKTGITPL